MDSQPNPESAPPLPPPPKPLRRIHGRRSAGWGAQSLWEGEDHLLVVSHGSYMENYQRLFFRDIESIVMQSSARRMVWNSLLGMLTTLALTMAALLPNGLWPGGIAAAALGLVVAINTLRGPTCRVAIATRVNSVRLYGLCRTRRARRVITRLAEKIAQCQGAYDPLAHAAALTALPSQPSAPEMPVAAPAASPVTRLRGVAQPVPLRRPEHGLWHRLLVCMLALEMFALLPFLLTRHASLLPVAAVALLLSFALTCVVLVRNVRLLAPRSWCRWAWSALAYQVMRGMCCFIVFTVLNTRAAMTQPRRGVIYHVGAEDLAGSSFVRLSLACFAVISLLMAVWGAFALRRGAPSAALPPPLPGTPAEGTPDHAAP